MKMEKHNLKSDMQAYGYKQPDTRNYKIIRNAIQCKHCGDIIESTYRHDFVTCTCGCCNVDGGFDYFRRGCMHCKEEDYIDLRETIEVDENSI